MVDLRTKLYVASSFLRARLFKKKLPLLVGWSVTGRCNRDCFYCNSKTPGRELSAKEALGVLDQLAAAGTKLVQFTGGEPLLRDDIGQLIRHAKSKNLLVNLSSNGALVPEKIKEIVGVDVLNLSLEGPSNVHDGLKGQGSYEEVMRALEVALRYGINVRLCMTLNGMNLGEADHVLGIAKKYSVKVFFQPAISSKLLVHPDPFIAAPEAFRKKINELIIKKKSGTDFIGNSLSSLRYFLNWPDKRSIFCGAGIIFCRFEPDGTMYPCSRTIEQDYAIKWEGDCMGSFSKLKNACCQACWANSLLEVNLLLSLDFRAMFDSLKGVASTGYGKRIEPPPGVQSFKDLFDSGSPS